MVNLYWTQIEKKKVAQYKGFTLTMSGHQISIEDNSKILPSLPFNNLTLALSHVDQVSGQRRRAPTEDFHDSYSAGCCDEL